MRLISILLITCIFYGNLSARLYEADWDSLDKRPDPKWYDDAKFGIFIHWGVYSVPSWAPKGQYAEWYGYFMHKDSQTAEFHNKNYGKDFRYEQFASDFTAELFDAEQWADIFKKSGARYVVLTSKHHDGFCLWPSSQSPGWNSVEAGPGIDIAGKLADAVRKQGLKMGYYYSLYEWHNPLYKEDVKKYVKTHMIPQLTDLVENYKPALIFADGEWDYESDIWESEKFLAWLFNDSPVKDTVVINDRWGKDCRSKHGGYYTSEYGKVDVHGTGLGKDKKWEENRGIGSSYGFNRNEDIEDYQSSDELVDMLIKIVSSGGNLLLNVGPTLDGRIPVIMQERLLDIGRWLEVYGSAIYQTVPCEITHQGDTVFFTQKDNDLYIILTQWPVDDLTVKSISLDESSKITLLGTETELEWYSENDDVNISTSDVTDCSLINEYANVLKVTYFIDKD